MKTKIMLGIMKYVIVKLKTYVRIGSIFYNE